MGKRVNITLILNADHHTLCLKSNENITTCPPETPFHPSPKSQHQNNTNKQEPRPTMQIFSSDINMSE